jgi:hypothetical protein
MISKKFRPVFDDGYRNVRSGLFNDFYTYLRYSRRKVAFDNYIAIVKRNNYSAICELEWLLNSNLRTC